MKSVVIVDDHPTFATVIAEALKSQGIADARPIDPDDPDAEPQLIAAAPDLCLLDLDLGHQLRAGMRFVNVAIDAGLPVVMMTGSTDEIALGRCIEVGVDGVLSKLLPFAEIIEKVVGLLDGERCNTDSEVLQWVLASQRFQTERRRLHAPFLDLTKREQAILKHLVEGRRAVEIADADFVSLATVRSQVQAVLHKLGVQSQLAAVAAARRADWSPEH